MTKAEKWDRLMAAFPWGDENADISGADVIQEVCVLGVTEPPPQAPKGSKRYSVTLQVVESQTFVVYADDEEGAYEEARAAGPSEDVQRENCECLSIEELEG